MVEMKDGSVLWFTQGRNSVPTYRITGWKGWRRQKGKIRLAHSPRHAGGKGNGARAYYFRNRDLSGRPSVKRVDKRLWMGQNRRKGGDAVLDGFLREGPTYLWNKQLPRGLKPDAFSARWTGEIEAPLTEDFTFSVYTRGGVRLWINGKQIIFGWGGIKKKLTAKPMRLEAGKKYALQLEYYSNSEKPAVSLNWESFSFDRRRVEARYLYPGKDGAKIEKPGARPAMTRINASAFSDHSETVTRGFLKRNCVRGRRQLGFSKMGAYLKYKKIDFGAGVKKVRARVTGKVSANRFKEDVVLEFRVGSPAGRKIATIAMKKDDFRNKWIHEASCKSVSGVQDLYVVNATEKKRWQYITFCWFEFK